MKISSLLFLLLIGCTQSSGLYYLNKVDLDGNFEGKALLGLPPQYSETEKIAISRTFNSSIAQKKEYCVYTVAFLIPLNFWDISRPISKIVRAIKDLNEEGKGGNAMRDVLFRSTATIYFPFSLHCTEITGILITEET